MAERVLRVTLIGDERDLERSFKRSSAAAKDFNQNISGVGRGVLVGTGAFRGYARSVAFAGGAFLGGAGFVATAKTAIEAASDLNEQTSKTRVVFAQSSKAILDWSKTTAGAFGLSQRQALATASSFGALFKPLGFTGALAARQSKQLTQLGADLASFYNTDVQDALDAIRSGIVGESEPLRRYGVLLSETRVQQEALNETGKKSAKQLTAQEKVQARLALIFKDSKVAQGDFARTSSGLANQLRILRANADDLAASVGKRLLPSLTNGVRKLNEFFSEARTGQGVDSKRIGAGITEGLSQGLANLENKVSSALADIDWSRVGKSLGDGLVAAINAIDVKALVVAFARLMIGVRVAFAKFGLALGKALAQGIGRGLASASAFVLEQLIKIVGPFKTLDRFLPGDPFRGLKSALEDAMIDMRIRASDGGEKVSTAFVDGLARGGKAAQLAVPLPTVDTTEVERTVKKTADKLKGITAAQRNTWFDAMIGRREDRVQDIASLRGQAAELLSIAARISQEIKRVTDPTRKLTLGDELVQVERQRRDVLAEVAAQAKRASDDAKQRARDLAEAAAKLRDARQFAALGLGPTGDPRIPGVSALRKQLGRLDDAIKDTFLDTGKTRSVLGNIRKVLSGGLGAVGEDVRRKIAQIQGDIDRQLKNHENQTITRGRAVSSNQILQGLGLSRDARRALEARLSRVGVGGRALAGSGPGAFGIAVRPLVVHTTVTLHDEPIARSTTKFQQKQGRKRATQTTGPHAGNGSGIVR